MSGRQDRKGGLACAMMNGSHPATPQGGLPRLGLPGCGGGNGAPRLSMRLFSFCGFPLVEDWRVPAGVIWAVPAVCGPQKKRAKIEGCFRFHVERPMGGSLP